MNLNKLIGISVFGSLTAVLICLFSLPGLLWKIKNVNNIVRKDIEEFVKLEKEIW